MNKIRVVVIEDHEILRNGLLAALADDRELRVITPEHPHEEIDIAVVSSDIARRDSFGCPIIVYYADPGAPNGVANGNRIVGSLALEQLTGAQLRATVRAAATGLQVNAQMNDDQPILEPRALRVLELIADGYTTREIAERMSYSERTIKKLVMSLEQRLAARSRAHVVARAIRGGLI